MKKIIISFVSLLVLFGSPFTAGAFFHPVTPNWNIDFSWNGVGVNEVGQYGFALSQAKESAYTWPTGAPGQIYGEIYKGELNNATLVATHLFDSSGMATTTDIWLSEGGYFVVTYNFNPVCAGGDFCIVPKIGDIRDWFEKGVTFSNFFASAPQNWGIINFTIANQAQNSLPALSYSQDGGYVQDTQSEGVEPNKGTANLTEMVFRVVYTDNDNDTPSTVNVLVGDGVSTTTLPMILDAGATSTLTDSDFTNGEQYTATSTFPKGKYQYYFETSDGTDTARLPAQTDTPATLSFEIINTPVVIVPGILGSYLDRVSDGKEVWVNEEKMLLPFDLYLNELSFNPDGLPDPDNPELITSRVIRSIGGGNYFTGLITELENNGYQEGTDLFVFPYDWRLRNETSALALKNKVEDILQKTGAEKVDIVAHSMGGFVAKYYIKNYGNNSVRKFVDIATPHLGAPKAFKQLMYGDDLGITFGGFKILNAERMKVVSRNMPSIYQLLPTQGYFALNDPDYDFYLTDIADKDENGVTGELPYNQTLALLGATEGNSVLTEENDTFYQSIKDWDGTDYRVETTNIVGCGTPTIGKIVIANKEPTEGFFEYVLEYITGDATVPLRSAEALISNDVYYVNNVEHSTMPSKDGIKQLVTSIVNGGTFDSTQYTDIRTDKNNCGFDGQIFSVHSPVELHIYDSQNRHIGPTPNGDIEIAIPGAQYDIIEGNKFAFLPSGDTYRVFMKATDVGSFNVRIKTIVDTEVTETKYYNQIPLTTLETSAKITLSPNQTNFAINVDQDGDTVFESQENPDSILDANKSRDFVKPETQILVDGIEGNNNWYLSDVQVTLTAMDDNSGVLKTEYSLDDGNTWNIYTTPLMISEEELTTILYKTTDNAGNIEIQKEYELKIDKTAPEAKIYFDKDNLKLKVEGTDNLTATPVVTSTTTPAEEKYEKKHKDKHDGKNNDRKEKHEKEHKGKHKDKHEHEKEHDNRLLTTYRIEDEAGNALTLTFKKFKQRGKEIKAELATLQYNNESIITLPKTTLKYEWSINKRTDQIKELEQKIKVKRQFEVKAKYRGKKDVTMIKVKETAGGERKAKFSGLKIINLYTNKSEVGYAY